MWYFGSHGEFVDRRAQTPPPGPGGLAAHDPDGFELLAQIYGGTHPLLLEGDPAVKSLTPAPLSLKASSDDEETEASEVRMEFDNRGCDCSWKLFWLSPDGKRLPYGEVGRGTAFVQSTYKGHAWLLERTPSAAAEDPQSGEAQATRTLVYVADYEACAAGLAQDAGCKGLTV